MNPTAPSEALPSLAHAEREDAPMTQSWNGGQILRLVGGAMLVASFTTFVLRRWDTYSDMFRYGAMLAHTVVLVAAALFCSFGMRENRGARTLLVLTLAAVPFNLAILAGFVYSRHCWDDASIAKPTSFLWVAQSEAQLLALLAVALPILVSSAWFALRALVRTQSHPTLALFVATNMLLLVPVRAPQFSTLLFILASVAVAAMDECYLGRISVLGTKEGRLVRLLLVTPLLVMLGRSMCLYPNVLLVAGAMGMVGGVWLAVLARRRQRTLERHAFSILSATVATLGWTLYWVELVSTVPVAAQWRLPTLLLPWAVVLETTTLATQLESRKSRTLAATAVFLASVVHLIIFPGGESEIYCAAVGILWLLFGVFLRSKLYVVTGGISLLAAFGYQLVSRIRFEYLSHWLFLSLTGVALILAASYLERRQVQLRRRFYGLLSEARAWNY